jgi:hypothetical protein
MTPQIRELLNKFTDFRQEVTHLDRMTLVNEVSRLQGELNEAQGHVNFATLQIAQPPNGSRFN